MPTKPCLFHRLFLRLSRLHIGGGQFVALALVALIAGKPEVRAEDIILYTHSAPSAAWIVRGDEQHALTAKRYYAAPTYQLQTSTKSSEKTELLLPWSGLFVLLDPGAQLSIGSEPMGTITVGDASGFQAGIHLQLDAGSGWMVAPPATKSKVEFTLSTANGFIAPEGEFVLRVEKVRRNETGEMGTFVRVVEGTASVWEGKQAGARLLVVLEAGQDYWIGGDGSLATLLENNLKEGANLAAALRLQAQTVRNGVIWGEKSDAVQPLPAGLNRETAISASFLDTP